MYAVCLHTRLERVDLIRHAQRYVFVCISGVPPAVLEARLGQTDNLAWLGSSLILNTQI